MKQFFLMIFAAIMSMTSCSSDDNKDFMVGLGDKMEVSAENVTLDTSKSDDIYINVPAEGKSFTLQVNNYDEWRVNTVSVKTADDADYKLAYQSGKNKEVYKKDWYQVDVNSNKAKCTISENPQSEARSMELVMTVGDVFQTIYIVQAAK